MNYIEVAENFVSNLEYRDKPYSARNWGHPWHSLCSYHGKMKPAMAHLLVKAFTNEGDTVLDPLCGVGTIPFEACLQGRRGIGNDLNRLAYVVTMAKVNAPDANSVRIKIDELENYVATNINTQDENLRKYSHFGFNGKLEDYFHPVTFRELLCARDYFIQKEFPLPDEALIFSCALHILHGNRPYALSRTSHPLTPYAPKGDFVYKKFVQHLRTKVESSYAKATHNILLKGESFFGDYSMLAQRIGMVDSIITSPPFASSIRFYMNNWMRLWFAGWNPDDFKNAESNFLEGKQKQNMDIYLDFFNVCNQLLKEDGKLILHLGKTAKCDMAQELSIRAQNWFVEIFRGSESVDVLEKHGIKDKGATTDHQFLFLRKR